MHAFRFVPIVVVALLGCGEPAPPPQHIQAMVKSWGDMGMYLPKQEEVDFLHANLDDVTPELEAAVCDKNADIRQRAAHVIGGIGPDAHDLGACLFGQLKIEPERLVQIYLIDALGAIRYRDDEVIAFMENKYQALSDENVPPKFFDSNYAEVDEKINLAGVLYVLVESESRDQYFDFVTKWLQPLDADMGFAAASGYWERRWMAVNALVDMEGAAQAVPLLEAMLNEEDAKSWVSVHVPRALRALK